MFKPWAVRDDRYCAMSFPNQSEPTQVTPLERYAFPYLEATRLIVLIVVPQTNYLYLQDS